MILLIIIILLYTAVICLDFLSIIKIGHKKTITVYSVMLALSFVVMILKNYNLTKPVISTFIINSIQQMFK